MLQTLVILSRGQPFANIHCEGSIKAPFCHGRCPSSGWDLRSLLGLQVRNSRISKKKGMAVAVEAGRE